MAELRLNIVAENIGRLKQKLENIEIGKRTGDNQGRGGGPSALGIGAAVAVLERLLSSVQSIQSLIEVIGGLINQLVAPFVPILINLIKPVFVLLQIFLSKVIKSLGDSGTEGGIPSIFGTISEKATEILLGVVAGLGAAIFAAVAGIPGLIAAALGLIVAGLAILAVDFGKKIAEGIEQILTNIIKFGGNALANIITKIDSVFGTNLTAVFIAIGQFISNVLLKLFDILVNLPDNALSFVVDFLNKLKALFLIVVDVFKNVWNFFIDGIKRAINNAASLFVKGLNGLISLLNKIPGINIGRVRGGEVFSDIGRGRSNNTVINFNVQGSADERTARLAADLFRREINRRSSF